MRGLLDVDMTMPVIVGVVFAMIGAAIDGPVAACAGYAIGVVPAAYLLSLVQK